MAAPGIDARRHLDPAPYQHIARVLETAKFDACFFADLFGLYDLHGGSYDASVRRGGQISFLDSTVVLPVMAAATRHLGLGAALSTSFHTAYHLARWLGSLDAMSGGRVAWNVVTSATQLEAQNRDGRAAVARRTLRPGGRGAGGVLRVVEQLGRGCLRARQGRRRAGRPDQGALRHYRGR